MKILLLFLALSPLCAAPEHFTLPSWWTRGHESDVSVKRLHPSYSRDLGNISIVRNGEGGEDISFAMRRSHVSITLKTDPILRDNSTIFGVRFHCARCSQTNRGFVVTVPLSTQDMRFMVVAPEQDPATSLVTVPWENARMPGAFCEYRAEKTRFTTSRFLYEYKDSSRYFVQAQVTYANMRDVVLEWGIREADGSLRRSDTDNRKEFNFPVCVCLRESNNCPQ